MICPRVRRRDPRARHQEQHGAALRGGGEAGQGDRYEDKIVVLMVTCPGHVPPAGRGRLRQEAGDGRGEVRARGARLQDRPLRGGGEGEHILVATRYLNLMCSRFCLEIFLFSDIIF